MTSARFRNPGHASGPRPLVRERPTFALRAGGLVALTLALVLVSSSTSRAQDIERVLEILSSPPPEPPKSETRDRSEDSETSSRAPATPIFHLRDQSRVAGHPRLETLPVETRYGLLEVPVERIVRVRFAARVDPALIEAADRFIAQLGDQDFDTREQAMASLEALGPEILARLRPILSSDDEEVKSRVEIVVESLEKKLDESTGGKPRGARGEDDEILTDTMTVRGRVTRDDFAIDSRYGSLAIGVASLYEIHFKPSGDVAKSVDVEAKHQPPGNWLDTRIDLVRGQRLRMSATGQTQVPDWGINSGPVGNSQYSGNTFGGFPSLALVGKIGKNGKPFLVGTGIRESAKTKGRLYLAIVPFQYDPGQTTGKYTVKLDVGASP